MGQTRSGERVFEAIDPLPAVLKVGEADDEDLGVEALFRRVAGKPLAGLNPTGVIVDSHVADGLGHGVGFGNHVYSRGFGLTHYRPHCLGVHRR